MNSELKRILVFRIGHLGDTIISLPAFWSIRDYFPQAKISLLSNSDPSNPQYVTARNVLPEEGLFDDWIVYAKSQGTLGKLKAISGLISNLRQERFDAAFYLMPRLRTPGSIKRDTLFLRSAGIHDVRGAEFLSKHFVDPAAPNPLPVLDREADFLLELLKSSGVPPSRKGCDMSLSSAERSSARAWMAENCKDRNQDSQLVALAPGSKWESKIWSEERYIEVIERLVANCGVYPVVFGGPEDAPKGSRILDAVGVGANAAGQLGVREGTAAMAGFDLFLGNDTGTMHMAAASGIRCVAIFAAIDFPGRWYPYGNGHKVFRVAVECEGCHTPDCFNRHLCLESVTPGEVYDACREILDS